MRLDYLAPSKVSRSWPRGPGGTKFAGRSGEEFKGGGWRGLSRCH